MCGIVGLFLKDDSLKPELGGLLADMLITMTDRGPDSAGIAVYGNGNETVGKITIQSDRPDKDFPAIEALLEEVAGNTATLRQNDTHAVITVPSDKLAAIETHLAANHDGLRVMSRG
ncbi:MAG: glutamine amidotransferase, partial [Pseudomonadota bacterium]